MDSNSDHALIESSRRLYQDIDYFIDTFYVDFIASHSSIKAMFSGVCMDTQREMLKHALIHIIGPVDLVSSESEIRRLGYKHRHKFDVTDKDKALFISAMVGAIEKVDPVITSTTLEQWEKLISERLQQF